MTVTKKTTSTIDVETAMRNDPIDPQTPHVVFIFMPHNQRRAELSLRVKCRINRLEQSRVAEWLEQALDRTLFE